MPGKSSNFSHVALVAIAVVLLPSAASAGPVQSWGRFGYDAARHNSGPTVTGVTAANVGHLVRRQVALDGTADSSPISVGGLVFVTTSYGKTIAIDPKSGGIRWRFTPANYSSLAGSDQITNSSPIASDDHDFVYSASPDGLIHKLVLPTGREVRSESWPVKVTRSPEREKLGTALNLLGRLLFATTGGYYGDVPPYQGHVAAIDARSGQIVHVWNALCSDQHRLLEPATCPESDAAIWARSGVVADPANGNLLVATGNGPWDGNRYWGDSVLVLSPDASRLLASWTPRNESDLNSGDVDLGSTAPAMLPGRLALQSGKDGLMRLLDLSRLGLGKKGGELQTLRAPGGDGVFTAPAVYGNLVFVATFSATGAYRLVDRRLRPVWGHPTAGTSPVVAGGLLYVYDPNGGLNVYVPATGRLLAKLPAGKGHWSSPIVVAGRVILPEGSANDHTTRGVLDIYSLG